MIFIQCYYKISYYPIIQLLVEEKSQVFFVAIVYPNSVESYLINVTLVLYFSTAEFNIPCLSAVLFRGVLLTSVYGTSKYKAGKNLIVNRLKIPNNKIKLNLTQVIRLKLLCCTF